ncbi:hypothetical protein SSS_08699 [Sarcoptes scabiei]|uniref:Ig-like domain-containing protein n=1 Tax=Sarcoptes scabiei TaxID=52283 RepID=A0A834R365_SARSC|nr:hypothetical protein SSS_08699 [Sarcoptes scabiei]
MLYKLNQFKLGLLKIFPALNVREKISNNAQNECLLSRKLSLKLKILNNLYKKIPSIQFNATGIEKKSRPRLSNRRTEIKPSTESESISESDNLTLLRLSVSQNIDPIKKGLYAVRVVALNVPNHVDNGTEVELSCLYDLDNASLYSLKWFYRINDTDLDEQEFFRYTPTIKPHKQFFPLDGIEVNINKSEGGRVFLTATDKKTTGNYKCEISVDGTFQTVAAEKLMIVLILLEPCFRSRAMINKLIKNLYESILFLPKPYRHKLYIGSSVLALTASTSIYISLQTFKIDRFVEHCRCIDLNELLHQVVMDFGPNKLNSPLCIFNFIGNDMYSIGNISLPTAQSEDIRFLGRFKTKRTAESPIIQQLFRSLLYSTQAKRFALAHEFNLLSSSYFFVKTFNIAFNT